MGLLDLWLAHLNLGLLIFLRLASALFLTPPLGARQVPAPVRLGLAAGLTFLATPLVAVRAPALPGDALAFAGIAAKEVLVGLALGWMATLALNVAQMAGELLDVNAGFSVASLINPTTDFHVSLLGQLKFLLASLIFLGTGAHHLTLAAILGSYQVCPVNGLTLGSASVGVVFGAAGRMLGSAIQLAAPVAATLFLAEVALGIANRALPQLNVMILSLSIKGLLALVALAVCLPVVGWGIARLTASIGSDVALLARGLGS
ncbi:MAG: flagellar biosynthetic protein FliR [Armatimonadetes bacterium]|nr:flagellar biosynthetic protein FliR [Armatimonadota bacterium]